MPASVASTSATAAGGSSRKERAMVKCLAQSLEAAQSVQLRTDRNYILETLGAKDQDLIPFITTLLRNGGTRKAVDMIKNKGDLNQKGKQLPASVSHFRKSMGGASMWEFLQTFEPTIFNDDNEDGTKLSNDEMARLLCFSLNMKENEKLPSWHPELRYSKVLIAYCLLRYQDMGSRLRNWDPDHSGYFRIVPGAADKIELLVPAKTDGKPPATRPSVTIAAMKDSDDWVIKSNHMLNAATLISESEDSKLAIAARFKKAKIALPPEPEEKWDIDQKRWPRWMLKRSLGEDDPEAYMTPDVKKSRCAGNVSPE